MEKLLVLCALASLVGCASSVHVTVNSVKNSDSISNDLPLVFVKKESSMESEKLRRECGHGAVSEKFKAVPVCQESCYWVVVSGETGGTRERTGSYYNAYTKQYQSTSSDETDRKMKVSIFGDAQLTSPIWEAVLDSSGETSNVLGVAREMCTAAFRVFPHEVTNQYFEIPYGK